MQTQEHKLELAYKVQASWLPWKKSQKKTLFI